MNIGSKLWRVTILKTITEVLTNIVSNAFDQCGYDRHLGKVKLSNRPDLCQYQVDGAFSGAKIYKVSPMIIANAVLNILKKNKIFSSVTVANPGFINLSLSDMFLVDFVNDMFYDNDLGIPQIGLNQTIVIDYGGPNVAKPLHIGHLRSAIIGEAIKRIARATGYKVVGDIHLGDWGMPIGLIIAELEERINELSWNDIKQKISIDTLNEVYPLASKKSKEDPAFKKKAQKIVHKLQNGHDEYISIWKRIVQVSVSDLKQIYKKLNVEFDLWNGESDSEKYIPQLIDILNEKKLLYKNLGALVVDVTELDDTEPIPPIIIKKSDDSNLYSTTDLATIIQRQKEITPNKYWYVVDNRQSLHFKQVFRCAKKAELVSKDTEFEFLGFGTMNGKDGKPYKTRDGGVMKLDDLLKIAKYEALVKSQTSHYVVPDEKQRNENAEKVSIAAIKFGDLINNRSKNYIFNLEKFLATDGKTGSYLLYTISRINSIQKKANINFEKYKLTSFYSNDERQILLNIVSIGDVFKTAILEKSPHYICESAYQIALSFSKFYNSTKILSEKSEYKRNSWIALIFIVRTFLLKHLNVLGIEPVDHM